MRGDWISFLAFKLLQGILILILSAGLSLRKDLPFTSFRRVSHMQFFAALARVESIYSDVYKQAEY